MSFLDRSTGDLLDLFAAGKNVPGAGSAAALQGAIAGSLLQAVARYSLKSDARAEGLLSEARERSERLRKAVDEDAAAFQDFWRSRTSEALTKATEIPLAIARDCAALAAMGLELHEKGFKNARGESAAAAWGALAAAETALYVARLNQVSRAEEIRSLAGDLRELRQRLEDATG
jgi:formiminotetrahydrofolate cyclodeaminase